MLEKLREVEAKYEALKRPLFRARAEVISNVPGFWLHCFMQHERIRDVLGAVDQEILASLAQVSIILVCQIPERDLHGKFYKNPSIFVLGLNKKEVMLPSETFWC